MELLVHVHDEIDDDDDVDDVDKSLLCFCIIFDAIMVEDNVVEAKCNKLTLDGEEDEVVVLVFVVVVTPPRSSLEDAGDVEIDDGASLGL